MSTPPVALSARAIVAVYAVASGLWIALSDRLAQLLFADPEIRTLAETVKGWGFVAVTGLTLLAVLRRYDAARARQADELANRERRFRLLAEHAQDVIFRFGILSQAFEYLSPAVERMLGRPPSAFYDDPELMFELLHPDDRPIVDFDGPWWRSGEPLRVRLRHADGRWIWLELRSRPVYEGSTEPAAVEGVARDVTEQHRMEVALERVNRVHRTLSAANQALVRAATEDELLQAICSATIEEGGARFAWVGYVEGGPEGAIRPVASAGHEDGYLETVRVRLRDEWKGLGPTATAVVENRPVIVRDIASDPWVAPWAGPAVERGYASLVVLPLRRGADVFGLLAIYSSDADAFDPDEVALLEELAGDLAYGVESLRARAAGTTAAAERLRLAMAIEQSAESVVITDASAAIEYVNPAFERVTGYARDEVVGRNPRVLQSGKQGRAFYEAMWQTLTDGRPWVGDVVNRRKDGSLFTEEAVISPVHGDDGAIAGYVAVKRDVTSERDAQAREQTLSRERAFVAQALAGLHPQATPEETADAVCSQIVQLPEAAVALVVGLDPDGGATPLGGAAAAGQPLEPHRLGEARAQHLRSRAVEGPWVESWSEERGQPFNRAFRALGIRALGYAPIRIDADVVALLEVGSASADAAERLTERLPALVEFASIAGAVLGPSISSRAQLGRSRERIRSIIERRAFHPVFQPIVDLASLAVVGYEALTRFEDGTAPDVQFHEAASFGLGVELECATLEAVLGAARALPATPWLNVNVSPEVILAREPLRPILARRPGPLVLEVTEHQAITDYGEFREAVTALGADVRIAVDDTGAGFASLRHIVELHPHIVKIDRSLVAGIDGDPARQALLAGLRHFAETQGCSLVAEGIETEGELAALVALGVPSGQGYLLGRPVPSPAVAVG